MFSTERCPSKFGIYRCVSSSSRFNQRIHDGTNPCDSYGSRTTTGNAGLKITSRRTPDCQFTSDTCAPDCTRESWTRNQIWSKTDRQFEKRLHANRTAFLRGIHTWNIRFVSHLWTLQRTQWSLSRSDLSRQTLSQPGKSAIFCWTWNSLVRSEAWTSDESGWFWYFETATDR